jgi:hypothetical protein
MSKVHIITRDNYGEAVDAIRDILLLYVEMAESYHGFGHAADVNVRFDPLKFVDAQLEMYDGYAPLIDINFLRAGSAMVILSALYDDWCEFEAVSDRFREAVLNGRLGFTPDIESVAKEAFGRKEIALEDPWFDEAVRPIYERYVTAYFEQLAKMKC